MTYDLNNPPYRIIPPPVSTGGDGGVTGGGDVGGFTPPPSWKWIERYNAYHDSANQRWYDADGNKTDNPLAAFLDPYKPFNGSSQIIEPRPDDDGFLKPPGWTWDADNGWWFDPATGNRYDSDGNLIGNKSDDNKPDDSIGGNQPPPPPADYLGLGDTPIGGIQDPRYPPMKPAGLITVPGRDTPWDGKGANVPPTGSPTGQPNNFAPFGDILRQMSQPQVYGGLPRSTGPNGQLGGWYTGQAAQAAALRGL